MITDAQRGMCSYWTVTNPAMTREELITNLMRKFDLDKNEAWISAVRFLNDRRA